MENNQELLALLNELYENISKAIKPVLESIKKIFASLHPIFLEAWKELEYDINIFNKNVSRKRFIKLLMSIGYQRNEAQKIAWKYHKEKGKYTILDYMIEKNHILKTLSA